jgi:hypothetical protein
MADTKPVELAKGAVPHESFHARHDAAAAYIETTPHYWIFHTPAGILWVKATGQKDARAKAGKTSTNMCLLYSNAGTALRVAEMRSAALKVPIVNEAELQAEAKADPEPDRGSKRDWEARKVAKK